MTKQKAPHQQMRRTLRDMVDKHADVGLLRPAWDVSHFEQQILVSRTSRNDILTVQEDVAEMLFCFQRLAAYFELPTHNAVAFFSKFIELEKSKNITGDERDMLKELLHLAISGRGFVFGTTFDLEHSPNVRPSDFWKVELNDFSKSNFARKYLITLQGQAVLNGGYYFKTDYDEGGRTFLKELEDQRLRVLKWKNKQKEIQPPNGKTVFISDDEWLAFFEIYQEYSRMQLSGEFDGAQVSVSQSISKRVKKELDELQKTAQLLMKLNRFRIELDEILIIKEDEENRRRKSVWIDQFLKYIKESETEESFKCAEKIAQWKVWKSLGLQDFVAYAKKKSTLNEYVPYPMLNKMMPTHRLTKDEVVALNQYKQHPVYKCVLALLKELQKPEIREIAPYYLLHWFVHKHNPKGPFLKKRYKFTEDHTKLNDSITSSEDERVHYYQKCNYFLFKEIFIWWNSVVDHHNDLQSGDKELCEALYTRCRHQVVKKKWLAVESRVLNIRKRFEEPIYQLYQQLDGIFDYSGYPFPQYANTICHAESMFYYFFEKQDEEIRKIARRIKSLISDEIVQEYKEKVFLSRDGFGRSTHSLEWHKELAEWLENLIRKDLILERYVVGDPDPYYPGSAAKLSEIDAVIQTMDASSIIYPEDLQPYLGFVQWYIQKICCEKMCAKMQVEVLRLCKRIYLNTEGV